MIVLGIDPGFAKMGLGVIDWGGCVRRTKRFTYWRYKVKHLGHTTVLNLEQDRAMRLYVIRSVVSEWLNIHEPNAVGIEQVFIGRNRKNCIKLAEARGAAMCAVGKAKDKWDSNLQIVEPTCTQVKSLCGAGGGGSKTAVKSAVEKMLKVSLVGSQDGIDALAVAIAAARMIEGK